LFARLGRPPSLLEQFAVLFTNPWLWIFGFIFTIPACRWASELPERVLELILRARVAHLWYPTGAYWLHSGVLGLGAAALLLLGVLGVRVDSRRNLQAALAAQPPKTPGGPLRCHECGADLTAPEGALGVRCGYCKADNLLLVPESWARRARKIERKIRDSSQEAKRLEAESRRRMRRSALWRVPLALGIIYLLSRPDFAKQATWKDFTGDVRIGLRASRRGTRPTLAAIPRCDREAQLRASNRDEDALIHGGFCQDDCTSSIVVPLFRGEKLKTLWRTPPAAITARFALEPRTFIQNSFAESWEGETLVKRPLSSSDDFFTPERSGFHLLQLDGPAEAAVELCYEQKP
jgi:LSD1 subclass zinc finger protein